MKKRLLLFILTALQMTLFGSFEPFLKRITNTAGNHQMKHIDFIYMINLDQRPEKFASCIRQLHPYGIFPYRFSAVNGWELSVDTINKLGIVFSKEMQSNTIMGTYYSAENQGAPQYEPLHVLGRTYFCDRCSKGAIGILLSHLSILQHALDTGFNTIWVMEDDIEVLQNPHLISDAIEKLDAIVGKTGWDILFTDQDTKNNQGEYVPCLAYGIRPNFTPKNPQGFLVRQSISSEFRRIGSRYGAYSFIIRKSGMEKILSFIKSHGLFQPYDIDFCLPDDIHLFSVTKDIVSTQIKALTDNAQPNYKK